MMKNIKKKIASAMLVGLISGTAYAGYCFCAEPDVTDDGQWYCHQWVCF